MSDVGSFIVGTITTAAGVFVTTLSFGLASPLGGALISFGVGQMAKGLFGGSRPSNREVQSNVASPEATHRVVYGRQKLGIVVNESWVNPASSQRKELIRAGVVCVGSEDGSGIENVRRIWLDDELAVDPVTEGDNATFRTAGRQSFFDPDLAYLAFRGTDAQPVPTPLNNRDATRWTGDFRNRGLAWVVFDLQKDKEVFPRIPNVTVEVDGNRVYDPRDGTWKFTNNPALCLLDYLTSSRYGAELFYPERDGGDTDLGEIDEQSFIDAANYCEEQVTDGAGGQQDRFAFDGFLDTGNRIADNVNALLAAMRGDLVFQNGRFRLVIRKARSSAKTLSESEIIGEWEIQRGGARKVPNRVVVAYSGGVSGDTTEETEWPDSTDSTFLDQDGGHPHEMQMSLPGVQDDVRARQIGMVGLREAREDTAVRVKCRMSAADLEVGDVVTIDHETPRWTSGSEKDFHVVEMELLDREEIRLTLKEYSAAAYDLTNTTPSPTPPPGANLPDRTEIPTPTNLATTSGSGTAVELGDGTTQPRILATWTAPEAPFYDFALVRYRAVVDADGNAVSGQWQAAPKVDSEEDQQVFLDGVKGGWEYEVEIRCRTTSGAATDWLAMPNATASSTGAAAPIIKPTSSEDGTNGTLTVEVVDPGGGTIDVEFFKRVGTGSFPGTPNKTVNNVASSGTASYTFALDPNRPTFVRVVATLDSNGNTNSEEVTFDAGVDPEVEHLQATVDGDTLEVFVSAEGDSDTAKIYLKVGDGSSPVDPTPANADATISGQSGSVNTGVVVTAGNVAYVKAVGETSGGSLGPVRETTASANETTSPGQPNILVDTSESADGTQGTLTATGIDPDGGTITYRFYTRQGNGSSYGSPDVTFSGVSSGVAKSHSVGLIEKKNSWIKVEVEIESNGRKASTEVAFNPGKTALLTSLDAYVDDSGTVHVSAAGDSDTATIDVSMGAPINETKTINGRSGSVSSTGTASLGDSVPVTATPKNADGAAGTSASTTAHHGKGETKSNVPTIDASKTDNGDGTVTVTFTGSPGPAGVGPVEIAVKSGILGLGSFGGFSASPVSVTVQRNVIFPTDVVGKARDTGADGTPESDPVGVTVAPLLDFFTPPGDPAGGGKPRRNREWDDGDYAPRAANPLGTQLVSQIADSRGKLLNSMADLVGTGGVYQVKALDIFPGAVTGPKTKQPGTDPGGGQTRIPQPSLPRWNSRRDRRMASGWSAEQGVLGQAVALGAGGTGSGFSARTGRSSDVFSAMPGVVEVPKSPDEASSGKVQIKDAGGNVMTSQMSVPQQTPQIEKTDAEVSRLDLRDDSGDGIYAAVYGTRGSVGSVRFEILKNGQVVNRLILNSSAGRILVNPGDALSTGEVWRVEATPYEGADAMGVEGPTEAAEVGSKGGTGSAEVEPGDSSSTAPASATAAERVADGDCAAGTDLTSRVTYSTANGGSSVRVKRSINGGAFTTWKTGLSTGVAQTVDDVLAGRAYDPNGTSERRVYRVELVDGSGNVLDSFVTGAVDVSHTVCGQESGGATPQPGDEGGDPRITSSSAARSADGDCATGAPMVATVDYQTADAPAGARVAIDRQVDSGAFENIASDLPVGTGSKDEQMPNRERGGAGTAETRTYRIRLLDGSGQTIAVATTSAVDTSYDVCSATAAAISVSAQRTQNGLCSGANAFAPLEVSITYDVDNAPSGATVELDFAVDTGSGFGDWRTLVTNLQPGSNLTVVNGLGPHFYLTVASGGSPEDRKYRARLVDANGNDLVTAVSGVVDTDFGICPAATGGGTFQ